MADARDRSRKCRLRGTLTGRGAGEHEYADERSRSTDSPHIRAGVDPWSRRGRVR